MVKKLVEYTPKLQRAVDMVISPLGYTEHTGSRQRGRSTFTDRRGSYGAGGGYNSYFKLVLIHFGENDYGVNIIDGAYEGEEDVLGKESFCYVNRMGYWVKGWESPLYSPEQGDVYFALKASINKDGDFRVDIVGVENAETLPDGDNNTAWYQLGRLLRNSDGSARIIQDHTSGVPQILWFYGCEDE